MLTYANFAAALVADVTKSLPQPQRTAAILAKILSRVESEGLPALAKFSDGYKYAMGQLCAGTLPDTVPGVGKVFHGLSPESPPLEYARRLAVLSWVEKFEMEGHTPTADYVAFASRQREAENHISAERVRDVLNVPWEYYRDFVELTPFLYGAGSHGPGACREGLVGEDKWLALERPSAFPDQRMTDVPKDFKKRRIIGIEPAGRIFAQKALAEGLRFGPLFTGQRRIASLEDRMEHVMYAARRPSHTTVDLKDASDRITPAHVEAILPHWYPALCRAAPASAVLPDGTSVRLGSMSLMGCGFTFEVETLIFAFVAACCGWERIGWSLGAALRCVRVFGDDIIIPRTWVPRFQEVCDQLGWVVNPHKTSYSDVYRETCGYQICKAGPPGGPVVYELLHRFTPRIGGVRHGSHLFLQWDADSSQLGVAGSADQSGLHHVSDLIRRDVLERKDVAYRWNFRFQRAEVRITSPVYPTRTCNIPEGLKHDRWFLYGHRTPDEETVRVKDPTVRLKWMPLRDFTCPIRRPD